jgi:hypothetical protein
MAIPHAPEGILDEAARIVAVVGQLPGVVAIAQGGSVNAGLADNSSDLDFHVYWEPPLAPAAERTVRLAALADPGCVWPGEGLSSWLVEDHFAVAGRSVELIYIRMADVHNEVTVAYRDGFAEEGFTTGRLFCFAHDRIVYDPTGGLGTQQALLRASYPDALRRAVVRRQGARLALYIAQLRTGQQRADLLYAQQIRTKLQNVYFDLLFAVNRQYHPGEKRLLTYAARCPLRPLDFTDRWERVARLPADAPELTVELGTLAAELCAITAEHASEAEAGR